MSKVRVIKKPDGTVAIIHPAPKSRRPDETEETWLERIFAKANPDNLPFIDMDSSELPQDREVRNAWELDDATKKIKINSVKAQKIREEKLILEEMERLDTQEKRQKAIANLKAKGELA